MIKQTTEFNQISTAQESTIRQTIDNDLEPLPAKKQKVTDYYTYYILFNIINILKFNLIVTTYNTTKFII